MSALTGVVSEAEVDMLQQYLSEIELAEQHKNDCIDKMHAIC